jgi:hypothetical protein
MRMATLHSPLARDACILRRNLGRFSLYFMEKTGGNGRDHSRNLERINHWRQG